MASVAKRASRLGKRSKAEGDAFTKRLRAAIAAGEMTDAQARIEFQKWASGIETEFTSIKKISGPVSGLKRGAKRLESKIVPEAIKAEAKRFERDALRPIGEEINRFEKRRMRPVGEFFKEGIEGITDLLGEEETDIPDIDLPTMPSPDDLLVRQEKLKSKKRQSKRRGRKASILTSFDEGSAL